MKYEVEVREFLFSDTITWYKDDMFHRLYGPALDDLDGSRDWYKEGYLHRLDGPAVERRGGDKRWHINDVRYSEQEFNQILKL